MFRSAQHFPVVSIETYLVKSLFWCIIQLVSKNMSGGENITVFTVAADFFSSL